MRQRPAKHWSPISRLCERHCSAPCDRAARGELALSDQCQLAIDDKQNAIELVAAPENKAGRRDHTIGALLARQPRIFLDAVNRNFGRAAEDREHRPVLEEVDGVVAPFTIRDHAPVEVENAIELETIERHPALNGKRGGTAFRRAALAWINVAR